ncbi:MAG: stage IV sporulation protein A [Clostridia bacterium]|nr:stage IV sporulation protein A [Clostridia bacterium]
MENYNIYEDIATRTQGALYIGVVGPVRTGKSTFIKRFCEQLVIPVAAGEKRSQMQDELPQSAGGKTIMTTEPKFVPAEPVAVKLGENTSAHVRLIDCVGFLVEGAMGAEEEGKQRLVNTPWQEAPLPFGEAAKIGTQKVIREHSTVAVLITTDGSITDIPRESYIRAEEATVSELKALGKPFVMLLNCREPHTPQAQALQAELEEKYNCKVLAINVESVDKAGLLSVLERLLFEFPVTGIDVHIPDWMRSLPAENPLILEISARLRAVAPKIEKMRDCSLLDAAFENSQTLVGAVGVGLNLSQGTAECTLEVKEEVFYQVVSQECGEQIANDFELLRYVKMLSVAKRNYDKIKTAFTRAEEEGYGVVTPASNEVRLEEPTLVRQGQNFGIHLTANAPSYHVIKVDVKSSVSPIVGSKEQGEQYVNSLLADYQTDEEKLWQTELFGKSLRALVADGLDKKSEAMPELLQKKMRRTISRIVNEGKSSLFCILL